MKKIYFWAMCSLGSGISGGDRIYMEFVKRWSKKYPVTVVTWSEGEAMMKRNGLTPGVHLKFFKVFVPELDFFLTYFIRILIGIYYSCVFKLESPAETYLYTASEFWMDSIPSFILKLRYPTLKWIATWYQTAPLPLAGFSGGRYRISALLLWLSQLPIKPLIAHFADYVLVNNDLEKKIFPGNNTIVVLGAVDIKRIKSWQSRNSKPVKKYAAVFQGRFHPQKGVVELVDIWKRVVAKVPKAKLAMVGDGPLMKNVKIQITKNKLQKNIKLFGFLVDGAKKYRLFSQSKLVVHPAFFDSGGMASAEAMAFDMPVVAFDLPSYDSYYPVGMIRVSKGDLEAFANATIGLLRNPRLLDRRGRRAGRFIRQSYSWDHRAAQILRQTVERKD